MMTTKWTLGVRWLAAIRNGVAGGSTRVSTLADSAPTPSSDARVQTASGATVDDVAADTEALRATARRIARLCAENDALVARATASLDEMMSSMRDVADAAQTLAGRPGAAAGTTAAIVERAPADAGSGNAGVTDVAAAIPKHHGLRLVSTSREREETRVA